MAVLPPSLEYAGSTIYASAKAAVHEYSRCLAVELRPYDITVNVVAPGDTVTERFLASRVTEDAAQGPVWNFGSLRLARGNCSGS